MRYKLFSSFLMWCYTWVFSDWSFEVCLLLQKPQLCKVPLAPTLCQNALLFWHSVRSLLDHILSDITMCLLLQPPGCIAYYLSNNVIRCTVYWQSTLHFSGFLIEFQSFLMNGVLELFSPQNEGEFILTDSTQCILGVVVTGIKWRH